MHKPQYSLALKWRKDGSFLFEATAVWKKLKATVWRIRESGRRECRYVYSSHLAGYVVCFPGEKMNCYYGYEEVQKKESFRRWGRKERDLYVPWTNRDSDLREIAARRPELRFLCRKFKGQTAADFVDVLTVYRKHPEIEPLAELGMDQLIMNGNFWRMREANRQRLCKWIRGRLPEFREAAKVRFPWKMPRDGAMDYCLSTLQSLRKDGREICEQLVCAAFNLSHDQYRYVRNKSVEPSDYENYIKAVIATGHDEKDDYWAFPNDFQKSFDKVSREKAAMERAEQLRDNDRFGDGIAAFVPLSKKTARTINGLSVYIPCSIEDISDQAEKLDQCLVRNGYIEKMAKLSSILVFVKSASGERLATAEIGWNKKLLQIYGHEYGSDRDRSQASPEAREAVSSFLSSLRLEKPKAKVPVLRSDDLFFKGVSDKMSDMFGKNDYEVGKVFDTGCPDSEFGPDCVSTKKSIHFCRDIHAVNKAGNFGGASKYIVVKALGKVCQVGDAFISNRIKVMSVVQL